ncbi:hypothetical protein QF023_000037 [Chryseobacterium sp. SLBN-27]|nr:hypothetical protein [Chryseobacterium sp. SLBN-27]
MSFRAGAKLPPETFSYHKPYIRKISILDESLKNETYLFSHAAGIQKMA